ncbi:MAG: DUF389 domain-containing protein [Pseudanabaenaceae cyanobacterium]
MKKFLRWLKVECYLIKKSLRANLSARPNGSSDNYSQLRVILWEEARFDVPFLVLIVGSCIIASLGLLSNSAAVIIGAMVVAPLMLPIRALAFAAIEGDILLFRQGLVSIILGTLTALVLAWLIGGIADIDYGSEIFARSRPNLLDLGIAITAGGISAYAIIEPKVSPTVAGTGIAVALMPPVCVVGLGLAQGNWLLSLGAALLYLTNLLGITLACMITFLLQGYTPWVQARKALVVAGALTSVLLVPLGISFWELVRQSRLESSLKQALLNRTITFQRLELVNLQTNWLVYPPEVRLTVHSREEITPKQVRLIEEFVEKAMGQPFSLVFEVSQLREVRREE